MTYAQQTDLLNLTVRANNLAPLNMAQVPAILQTVSDWMDGLARGRWGHSAVPLIAWDTSWTYCCAQESTYRLYLLRGMSPKSEDWEIVKMLHTEAVDYMKDVQHQQRHPLVTLANGNAPGGEQPIVSSSSVVNLSTGATGPNRGW